MRDKTEDYVWVNYYSESSAGLKDVKSAAKHISTFNGLLNQLQDLGLQIFNDKIKAIFLLMTLSETWAALVVILK